ncbi:VanW family protein [bacterium]|nr:VanW family protein [bacterium]
MKWIIYSLIALLLVLAVAAGALSVSTSQFRKSDVIAQHVTIAGVDVGKLTNAEARQKLEAEWLPTLPQTVSVEVGGETRKLSCDKLGRQPQIEQAVAQAWRVGREGGLIAQLATRLRMMRSALDIPVKITVDETDMSAELVRLAAQVDREPVDASVTVSADDDVTVVPGKPGVKLDRKASAATLTDALTQLSQEPVKLASAEAQPRVSAQDLAHLEVVLGSYHTPYNSGKVDRTHNLGLAIQAINKTIVMPGEEFSTDKTIGPRIAERGFREAPIFQDGEVTPATGGGICQIATTIYNAALFAGLDVVERHHHSQPVTYAPAGRDATVYAGQLDLRFRNTTGFPILILGSVGGGEVSLKIIGKREANRKVRLERSGLASIPYDTKEMPDPTLDLGKRKVDKPGRKGIKVTVTRVIVQPDGKEKRETLHSDVYRPQTEVIHVGTKPTFYKGKDGKPIVGPDGKPVPVKLGPDGKPLPYKPPGAKPAKPANGHTAARGAAVKKTGAKPAGTARPKTKTGARS